jgi:hypothetical protein
LLRALKRHPEGLQKACRRLAEGLLMASKRLAKGMLLLKNMGAKVVKIWEMQIKRNFFLNCGGYILGRLGRLGQLGQGVVGLEKAL